MSGSRVLVVTTDRVGATMAGPGIRAAELARVLAGDGHDVAVASPYDVDDVALRPSTGTRGRVRGVRAVGRSKLAPWAAASDVVVGIAGCIHAHRWMADLDGVAIVTDAYDPTAFETLEQLALGAGGDGGGTAGGVAGGAAAAAAVDPARWAVFEGALQQQVEPLRWSDLVLCASERQRDLLLGTLSALGRVNPATHGADPALEQLVAVVPFGLPQEPPRRLDRSPVRAPGGPAAEDDLVLLWAGGVYDWLDPLTLVEAVARAAPHVKAFFPGVTHPTPAVGPLPLVERLRRRCDELALTDRRVFFGDGWVPYDERAGWLLDADVGVSLHGAHLETRFAFRTRMLDYLWTALPVVCTSGDSFADLVHAEGFGVVTAPGDVEGVAAAVASLDAAEARDHCRARLAAAAPAWLWSVVSAPLRRFCAAPRRAPDRLDGGCGAQAPWVCDEAATSSSTSPAELTRWLRGAANVVGNPARRAARRVVGGGS